MRILGIDPGDVKSAYVLYDTDTGEIIDSGIQQNELLTRKLKDYSSVTMAIEMIASYGMPVGKTVFETCVWIGRFIQAWYPKPHMKIYRTEVKMHLCHTMKAKDGNIRQAIIDRYPPSGGGKTPQIGTKKEPGPLYGVSKDIWSALAVAITFDDRQNLIEPCKEL